MHIIVINKSMCFYVNSDSKLFQFSRILHKTNSSFQKGKDAENLKIGYEIP